jgi:Transposase DDE domain
LSLLYGQSIALALGGSGFARIGNGFLLSGKNRFTQVPVDGHIYALRNQVERCFNKLKNARRLATRYDKTSDSYRGFVTLASICMWMEHIVNTA